MNTPNEIQKEKYSFTLLKNLKNESFSSNEPLEITCLIFKSIDDLNLIIYSRINRSIVCYDINNDQKVNEVLNAHHEKITYLNKYTNRKNKINVMLSISSVDNNLKVWNISNFQCLCSILGINKQGWINCACFLNNNNQVYVLTTNSFGFSKKPDPIKVFDLKGRNKNNIKDSQTNTYFIDVYYDDMSSKKYIITGNAGFCRSYDYNQNIVYRTYFDNDSRIHVSSIIKEKGDKVELIESCQNGSLKIWDFHKGYKIGIINFFPNGYYDICLWDNDYLLSYSKGEKNIEILDLNKKIIIKTVKINNKRLIKISKVIHSQYGECLVFQEENGFMLWKLQN